MEAFDCTNKYCIVGAGSSGLAAAKNLKAHDIPFDVIEAEDDVGGNWYYGKPRSSVYRSTHLISSKPLTEYTDFPMPAQYPDYPSHAQVWEYLRSYAKAFGLYETIEFNTAVARIEKSGDGWEVTLNNNETRRYRGVIIAKAKNFRRLKNGPQPDLSHGIKYLDSTRHYVEIEHFNYRERLKKLIKKSS